MATEQTNKHGNEPGRRSSPQFAASSWVDALAQSWERRADSLKSEAETTDYAKSRSASNMANVLQQCAKDLRAGAESASTDSNSPTLRS